MIFYFFSIQNVSAQLFIQKMQQLESGKNLLSLKPNILTDSVRKELQTGFIRPVIGRDQEVLEVFKILVRLKSKNPILLGEAGVGKTEIVYKLAQMIVEGQYPTGHIFKTDLSNSEIIQFDAAMIETLHKKTEVAVHMWADFITDLERQTGQKIIVFIDELHTFAPEMLEALKTRLDSTTGLKFIGATTASEYLLHFGNNKALLRRFAPVGVSELTDQETLEVINLGWKKTLEDRYKVEIPNDVIKIVVKNYKKTLPDVAKPDGPIKVLMDLAIEGQNLGVRILTPENYFNFVTTKTKLPANPMDLNAINAYLNKLRTELNLQILGQPELIDKIIEAKRQMLLSGGTKPISVVLIGPTGVGKTLLAETIADNPARFFKIDGAAYGGNTATLSDLLGGKPGLVGYKDTSGSLVEWMENPGKGKYGGVLLIDEIEKMNPDVLKQLGMSLLERGEVTKGNGQKVKVSDLLIIATSNHNVENIFPEGFKDWTKDEIDRRVNSYSQSDLKNLFTKVSAADNDYKLPKELVGRINLFILTRPLSLDVAIRIARLEIAKQQQLYFDRNALNIQISDSAAEYLTRQIFNPEDGAREIVKAVERLFAEITTYDLNVPEVYPDLNHEVNPSSFLVEVDLVKTGGTNNWYFTIKSGSAFYEHKNHGFKSQFALPSAADMSKLLNLEDEINKHVFGQKDLIQQTVKSVKSWFALPTGRPLVIGVFGSTGGGKTETAKVLAKLVYGSERKSAIIPLGDISSPADLTKIFGANPQYIKSDQLGLFEKALMQIKDGGVLVLDEISNAGEAQYKEIILSRFYNIFEEGFWVSPNTGLRYDLSKIVIWLTGNDLQELYYGISSDEGRRRVYEKSKNESYVRSYLRKKGFQEALLGRIDLVAHSAPLYEETRTLVAQKFSENANNRVLKNYPNLDVVISDQVTSTISDLFFNHDQGGRSLRSRYEREVQGLIAEAILQLGIDSENSDKFKIEISINDNSSSKFYFIPRLRESIEIQISVFDKSVQDPLLVLSNELLDFDPLQRKPEPQNLLKTAFHEIGHALLSQDELTGHQVQFITIAPGTKASSSYLGYVSFEETKARTPSILRLKASLMRSVAGRIAQELAGFLPDAGWSSDFENMKKLIGQYYVRSGLKPELWGLEMKPDGTVTGSDKLIEDYENIVRKEIKEASITAREYLKHHHHLMRFLVAQLMKKQSLSGDEFRALVKFYNQEILSLAEQQIIDTKFANANPKIKTGLTRISETNLLDGTTLNTQPASQNQCSQYLLN